MTKTPQQLAEEGARAAAEHADRVHQDWTDRAIAMFKVYAEHFTDFLAEDVRVFAHSNGLPPAPDPRAWGHVARKAVSPERLVAVSGYRNTRIPPAHAGPRAVYRSLIMGGIIN